jgi:hypothetical protein
MSSALVQAASARPGTGSSASSSHCCSLSNRVLDAWLRTQTLRGTAPTKCTVSTFAVRNRDFRQDLNCVAAGSNLNTR